MKQDDFKRFNAVMNAMAKLYEKEIDEAVLDLYWITLRDWSLPDFESAAAHLMGKLVFMPRPSDFNALKRAGELTAGEAWEIALKKCTCWHGGETPGGRIDRAAKAIGGYHAIAMADQQTALPHLERRFKEAYEELSDVEPVRQALPHLTINELTRIAAEKENKLLASTTGDGDNHTWPMSPPT